MSVRIIGAIAVLAAAVLISLAIGARMQAVDLEHRGVEVNWEKRSYDPADEGDKVKMKIKDADLMGAQCTAGALVIGIVGVLMMLSHWKVKADGKGSP